MSKHTIRAWCPFGLQPDSLEVEITYTYTPGAAAIMYGDAPQPADPEELDFISARMVQHDIDAGLQKMLDEWAGEYLSTDGFEDACENADREGDR